MALAFFSACHWDNAYADLNKYSTESPATAYPGASYRLRSVRPPAGALATRVACRTLRYHERISAHSTSSQHSICSAPGT